MAVDVAEIFVIICLTCVFGLLVLIILLFMTSKSKPDFFRYESEKYFLDPNKNNERIEFPSLSDIPSISLSVIIPSYNEEERLPKMLTECLEFLETRKKKDSSFSYEVIVVDDGSKDKTSQIGLKYSQKLGTDYFRVLTLERNRGKGGAVKWGIFSARGHYILFADADGATKFSDFAKLENAIIRIVSQKDSPAIIIGSRAHLQDEAIANRSFFRTILMYGFHFLVWILCVRTIRDTQCGFKLFNRKAAYKTFSNLHVERWAFDVELLYIAEKLKIQMEEIPVNWQEIEGSKLIPFWSWIQMGKDLLLIWLKYTLRIWKIKDPLITK